MPPKELGSRLIEHGYGIRERLVSWVSSQQQKGPTNEMPSVEQTRSLLSGLAEPDSVLLPDESRESLATSFRRFFPGRCEKLCAVADQICDGTLRLFGQAISFPGGRIDWYRDWAIEQHLPHDFYRDIPKLDLDRKADLKRVWETNRHQFLVTLGQAYFLTGYERYAESALDQIDSWIQSNPSYCGVNWMEALEVSLRICSWIWTLTFISGAPCLTSERARPIFDSIQTQRKFIERHLSTYSSPNTHLLGEGMGLFLVSIALEALEGSKASMVQAQSILEGELDRQFAADGSHREQSSYYHAYALDMYLLPTIIGCRKGTSMSGRWSGKLNKMFEYFGRLVRPNGELACFGDDDGGRTLRLAEENYYRPRSLGALGALLFRRSEFKPAGDDVPEEVFWLFGTDGVHRYSEISKTKKAVVPVRFPDAGFALLSEPTTDSRFWLACLGKPMGMMTAGHSHAAPLSFELAVDGVPIFVDPGTYTYQANLQWRNFFRGPSSHNVLELEDAESFVPDGPFKWKDKNIIRSLPIESDGVGYLETGYTGLDRFGHSYLHVRRFSYQSPTEVRIEDRIEGSGSHRMFLRLQLASTCVVECEPAGSFLVRSGDVVLRIALRVSSPFEGRVQKGSLDPVAGWFSPHYGLIVAAPALCFEGHMELPAALVLSVTICSNPRAMFGPTRIS